MLPGVSDRILVWSYSNTDAYTLEYCDWYSPSSFDHMQFEVSQFIRDQLDEFYAEFSEWFNLAEFPDVEEQFLPPEKPVFLRAAGAPADTDFGEIENYDCFSGLCAVIRYRLDQRSLGDLKEAAELFNWTIDFGLFCCDTKASAVVRMGSADDVAPYLLERILNRLPNGSQGNDPFHPSRLGGVERRLLPFVPIMRILKEAAESGSLLHNEVALRILYLIVDAYKAELLNEVV
jgi:hypothetical protein